MGHAKVLNFLKAWFFFQHPSLVEKLALFPVGKGL
jgi:hypothetical protein